MKPYKAYFRKAENLCGMKRKGHISKMKPSLTTGKFKFIFFWGGGVEITTTTTKTASTYYVQGASKSYNLIFPSKAKKVNRSWSFTIAKFQILKY